MDILLQVAASWILPALFFWILFSLLVITISELTIRFLMGRDSGLASVVSNLMGERLKKEFYKNKLANPVERSYLTPPTNISPTLFAKVIIEWMLPNNAIQISNEVTDKGVLNERIQNNIKHLTNQNAEFGNVLLAIVTQANMKQEKVPGFLDAIQKDLEIWFFEAVNQFSSIRERVIQSQAIISSFIIAIVANFDVINITVRLWETSKYAELLTLAEKTGQAVQIDTNLITMLPVGWYNGYLPSTLTEWLLKIAGIYLGFIFIFIGSQYIYNLSKKQYRTSE